MAYKIVEALLRVKLTTPALGDNCTLLYIYPGKLVYKPMTMWHSITGSRFFAEIAFPVAADSGDNAHVEILYVFHWTGHDSSYTVDPDSGITTKVVTPEMGFPPGVTRCSVLSLPVTPQMLNPVPGPDDGDSL